MLEADEVVALTGHPVGGVCPFGLATPLAVFCDLSLKDYLEVLPAAGATTSAVRIDPLRMAALVDADHAVHRLCKPVGAARGWLPVQR